MSTPLNVLYLHSHDSGRYVQPYGHAIETPNLQRLAEGGVLFRKAFCAAPTCTASRAAMLTGRNPHSAGMLGLTHRGWTLNDYSEHIIHTLKKAGYTSTLAGVQHIAYPHAEAVGTIGYDKYLCDAPEAHHKAVEFLENAPAEPFFLSVGFSDTHREFRPLDECTDDPNYCMPPAPIPDTPETRRDMARYKQSARDLDWKMGMVLAALRRTGLDRTTLVICTTDHGIAFPRMKCTLTDSGTGVMLILSGPGEEFRGGRAIDAMVGQLDIYPTLCDLLNIERPSWLEGESLLPLLRGQAEEIHEELFSEVTFHASYEPQRAVRTQRYKYIRYYDERVRPVLPNCDDGESKSVWMDAGWTRRDPPNEALYDLTFDPNEANNLAGRADCAEVLADMRRRLDAWMRRTDDPLLGPLPVPLRSGMQTTDVDVVSPKEKIITQP